MQKERLVNKYEYLFEKQIIYRGKEYHKNGMVKKVYKSDNKYIAKVSGSYSNEYNINIEIDKEGIFMHCDCPYSENCKHEYAVLMAIDNKEYKALKLLSIDEPEKINIKELLKVIPEDKLKKYIEKSFEIDGEIYVSELIEEFEVYLPEKPKEYFYKNLFNDFQLEDFDYNLNKFINLAEKALEYRKYHYAFTVVSAIIEAYKDSEYEDNKKIIFAHYDIFAAIIRIANRKGNKALKDEIQEWIKSLKDKNYYDDIYLEDMIEMIK